MFTLLVFIIVLSILVLVHEFGHFYVAKKSDMRVEEFGFGFPPRIFGIKKGETIYSVNWIPFGGFVRVYGEGGEGKDDPRSFVSKPISQRAKVIVAGVVMNLLLAMVLLGLGNWMGLRIGLLDNQISEQAKDVKIQILQIASDSPAQAAGLRSLDEILALGFNGEFIKPEKIEDVQKFVKKYTGKEIQIKVLRNKKEITFNLTPRVNPPQGQGAIGISLAKTGIISYPWYEAIWRGIYDTIIMTANISIAFVILIKNLIIDSSLVSGVSGPIGIAVLSGQAASLGIRYLLQFIALLSINLAILNIIPFPALDGGRLLLLLIEKIKGSSINKKTENFINAMGFALLIAFMVWITIKDIVKFF